MTVTATNRGRVVAYYGRVVGAGRLEEIPRFIAESYVDHNPPENDHRRPAVVEAHLRAMRTIFPDFALHIHEVIAEGDWVALRVIAEEPISPNGFELSPPSDELSCEGSTSTE